MLQKMRDNMKYVLGVVAVAFIIMLVFSWGMGGFKSKSPLEKGIVGVVNGQDILYQQFTNVVSQQLESYRQQTQTRLMIR